MTCFVSELVFIICESSQVLLPVSRKLICYLLCELDATPIGLNPQQERYKKTEKN